MTSPKPPSTASAGPRWFLWIGGALAAAWYLGFAAFHVAYGAMNVDEGFYAAAARAVWQGEVPYRDFGFTQMPLVPFVNAPALALVGFGLFEQRVVNGLWGLVALLLAARLVRRRAGMGWAVLVVTIFGLSPAWMYFIDLGKTYGLTSTGVMAATTVFLEWKNGPRKTIALSLLGVIGVGLRLPAAPFFGVLWLAALWDGPEPKARRIALAVGSLVGCAALILLPFYLAAPDQSVFWTIEFHRVSVPNKNWRLRWGEIIGLSPALWALAATALGWPLIARRQWRGREAAVLAAALVTLATNLLPRGVYEEYGVPFLPPLAVASCLLVAPLTASWPSWRIAFATVMLVVTPIGIIPALNWSHLSSDQRQFPSLWLPANARPYNFELATNLRRATEVVSRLLPPGEPFIGPAIILAIEADRPIPRTLRMGAFTMTSDFPTDEADRLHLMSFEAFERRLRDIDLPILAFYNQRLFNYAWSVPSMRYQTGEEIDRWGRLVGRNYFVPVYGDSDFAILARPHVLPLRPR